LRLSDMLRQLSSDNSMNPMRLYRISRINRAAPSIAANRRVLAHHVM
jgi:hypothetical protein